MHEGGGDGAVTAAIVFARLSLLTPSFLAFSLPLSPSFADHNLPASGCRTRLCRRRTGNDLSRRLDTHATTAAASSPDQTTIGELLLAAVWWWATAACLSVLVEEEALASELNAKG